MRFGVASKIRKALKPGGLRKKVLPYLWYYSGLAALTALVCRMRPIKRGKVVFTSFHGRGFGDHQKYIVLELLRRGVATELVWLSDFPAEARREVPSDVRVASLRPFSAIREMSNAQFWVDSQGLNRLIVWGLVKRPGQTYIQTFHGSLGIKRVGADIPSDGTVRLWVEIIKRDAEMLDYLVSNSRWESEVVYRSRFFGKGRTMEFGHPRNDVFFSDRSGTRRATLARLGVAETERIVLVAQTWRGGGRKGLDFVIRGYEALKKSCEGRFGGSWRVAVRHHPNMIPFANELECGPGVVDATSYPDMQDLLVSADALISDYSSCMFDFMLTRRPVFVYAPDIDEYERGRGFYYPMSETPFPVAKTEAELAENIKAFDEDKYRAGVEAFLKGKGCVEDGHATERVCDLIEKAINATM